jgi:hypothetical protein
MIVENRITRILKAMEPYSCLKNRQFFAMFFVVIFIISSCGKVTPFGNSSNALSYSEYSCGPVSGSKLPVSKEIENLFSRERAMHPQGFFFIEPRIYNFENPLVLSVDGMKKELVSIKNDPLIEQRSSDLFFLFNNDLRFESQRCQFGALAEKKKYDLRPYLNITHACYKKFNNVNCDDSEYINMSAEKLNWTKTNAIDLCLSFSKNLSCIQEFRTNLQKNTLGSMIKRYQDRFISERYETLFKLRPTHNQFSCSKDGDNVVMNLKIYGPSFDQEYLRRILDNVEATWKNNKFSLKLELVNSATAGVIRILPTDKSVSYVPDNDNRLVFLSESQEFEVSKRVLAHEFGHVLGFPDCYIEFFDDMKKELVYYEISKNFTNIMCSMKNGVQVPEDYYTQLEQNSCIFNQN